MLSLSHEGLLLNEVAVVVSNIIKGLYILANPERNLFFYQGEGGGDKEI